MNITEADVELARRIRNCGLTLTPVHVAQMIADNRESGDISAMLALESLTPNNALFKNNIGMCVGYVKSERRRNSEILTAKASAITKLKEDHSKYMKNLGALTPGGPKYAYNPQRCIDYIKCDMFYANVQLNAERTENQNNKAKIKSLQSSVLKQEFTAKAPEATRVVEYDIDRVVQDMIRRDPERKAKLSQKENESKDAAVERDIASAVQSMIIREHERNRCLLEAARIENTGLKAKLSQKEAIIIELTGGKNVKKTKIVHSCPYCGAVNCISPLTLSDIRYSNGGIFGTHCIQCRRKIRVVAKYNRIGCLDYEITKLVA